MNSLPEWLFQYGIAGLALYLLYDIAHNHLYAISEKLDIIISILQED